MNNFMIFDWQEHSKQDIKVIQAIQEAAARFDT